MKLTTKVRLMAVLLAVVFIAGLGYSFEIRSVPLEDGFFFVWAVGYVVLVVAYRKASKSR